MLSVSSGSSGVTETACAVHVTSGKSRGGPTLSHKVRTSCAYVSRGHALSAANKPSQHSGLKGREFIVLFRSVTWTGLSWGSASLQVVVAQLGARGSTFKVAVSHAVWLCPHKMARISVLASGSSALLGPLGLLVAWRLASMSEPKRTQGTWGAFPSSLLVSPFTI